MPPNFLSAIPGISNLPNPLNLFNNDDAQQQSQSPSSPTTSTSNRHPPSSPCSNSMAVNVAQPPDADEGPASRFVSMISRGLDVLTLNSNPSTPLKPIATEPESGEGSPTPMRTPLRTDRDGSASSGSSPSRRPGNADVVIGNTAVDDDGQQSNADGNRRRGLSSASRGSGGIGGVGATGRRKGRVETYVLVKPPPTSSKNPLNLQLQLVMPTKPTRTRTGSDAASRSMAPPMSSPAVTTSAAARTFDETPATTVPARQSFETPATLEETANERPDPAVSSSTAPGSTTSDAPLSEAASGAPHLPPLPENQAQTVAPTVRRRSSTGSQASTSNASVVSSTSAKHRIIPLYNLSVHNVVQPTIVTDAGTDSRVAKFHKRHLDINGVGILEPSEVWLPLPGGVAGSIAGNSPRPSIEPYNGVRVARPPSIMSNISLLSPSVTREDTKHPNTDAAGKAVNLDVHGLRVQDERPKKFFGKIFRKRNAADPKEHPRRGSITGLRPTTFLAVEPTSSLQVPPSTPPLGPAVHFNPTAELEKLGHPTFGLAPTVMARNSSQTNLDMNGAVVGLVGEVPRPEGLESDPVNLVRSGRPVGYTWTVRRWAKKNMEGWASHIVAAAAAGLDMVGNAIPGDGADEVVFEWVKMRFSTTNEDAIAALRRHPAAEGASLIKRTRPLLPTPSSGGSPASSRVNLLPRQQPHLDSTIRARKGTAPSPVPSSPAPSKRRASPTRAARSSDDTASADLNANYVSLDGDEQGAVPTVQVPDQPLTPEDDDYDSDPEDSETPWACSVWVKRTGQRQLLATLTPAPHHPKVIAVLKIPSVLKGLSLTDVCATTAKSGPATDVAARIRDEVCLTEENLKDVVSVTAMWLVAREEFSGFGRKDKRKV